MVITIKAKKPGLWNVYKSEGIVTNMALGQVRRVAGEASAYYFYTPNSNDVNPNIKRAISSDPRTWPNTIKNIVRSIEHTPS